MNGFHQCVFCFGIKMDQFSCGRPKYRSWDLATAILPFVTGSIP
ncbi:hypothetical protein B4116_0628 [Bacillus cereus]|nr:hypothetical protein B4085_5439 [Bacillus cereus]KZD68608.1 hypothetical protein B4116_0628 [Bacillus cereus]